jgi:RNA polymerase primary sigma factor
VEASRQTTRERLARQSPRRARPALRERSAKGAADGSAGDPEQLQKLVLHAQEGEPAARERLLEQLLPLVESLARAQHVAGLEHQDLVQEGCVGVLRALARYDPSRGVPFPAYALWWIRQALQEARSDFLRPFRLPPKALRQLAQLKSAHQRIYVDERREPGSRRLAEETAIPPDQVESLLAANPPARSLDEPLAGTENEIGTLGELLADPVSADAYEEVLRTLAGQQMRTLLGTLTARERDVVDARFGFDRPTETLSKIGERQGISAERVRQIEQLALAKLRQSGPPTAATPVSNNQRAPAHSSGGAATTLGLHSALESRVRASTAGPATPAARRREHRSPTSNGSAPGGPGEAPPEPPV